MTWFFNSYSGKLVHEDPPAPGYYVYAAALKTGTGWHELNVAPDATQAEAQAAAKLIGGAVPPQQPNASIGSLAGTAAGSVASQAATGHANTFSSVEQVLSSFYDQITNVKMWRSLGWLLLGILLIISGLIMWLGPVAFKASPIGRIATLGR